MCPAAKQCLVVLMLALGLACWTHARVCPPLPVPPAAAVPAAEAPSPATAPARTGPAPAAVEALHAELARRLAAHERGERWKSADSGMLAWSCGQELSAMVDLYAATGDRKWLDQLVRYADAMFANLTRNRDGFLSWRSRSYSSVRVRAVDRPKDFDFAVHDGVILAPICRFIALVRAAPDLRAAYGPKADAYLKTIQSDLIPKWKPYWRDWRDGGLLVNHTDEALGEPGISLPHNQYLALGQVMVWLHRITGGEAYRDRAEKMARFFKSCLRPVGDRYEWNYWDATGAWDKPWDRPEEKRAEDTGHGSIDIGFVLACADSGIVFTDADLRRFANTFLAGMWNGSLVAPTVGGYVNTRKPTRQSGNLQQWVLLSKVDAKVRDVCERIIPADGSLAAKAQLRLLWAAERRTPP